MSSDNANAFDLVVEANARTDERRRALYALEFWTDDDACAALRQLSSGWAAFKRTASVQPPVLLVGRRILYRRDELIEWFQREAARAARIAGKRLSASKPRSL